MATPLNRREFDIFLSHASKDSVFVSNLDKWLTTKAGFEVWYDARELSGGSPIAAGLQSAIERCRGILLLATPEAIRSGWVRNEYEAAMDERANNPGFRVVAVRVGSADTSIFMKGLTWIDMPGTNLDAEIALAIIRAFYPGERHHNPTSARDIYMSCSWHADDNVSARLVAASLDKEGFRLIGDAPDQKGFGTGNRVERIIQSCSALVCVIPYRDDSPAQASDGPYRYFLRELEFARDAGIPSVVVADPRVRQSGTPDTTWLPMDTSATSCPMSVSSAIRTLAENWQTAPRPQSIFCAVDLDSGTASRSGPIRHMIERITGMKTVVGKDIDGPQVNTNIMHEIKNSFVVLADITDDNLNTCIEAGMALIAGVNLELVTQGPSRRPPFMLRSIQMLNYEDELDQIGVVHRIAKKFRRRILNAELY